MVSLDSLNVELHNDTKTIKKGVKNKSYKASSSLNYFLRLGIKTRGYPEQSRTLRTKSDVPIYRADIPLQSPYTD